MHGILRLRFAVMVGGALPRLGVCISVALTAIGGVILIRYAPSVKEAWITCELLPLNKALYWLHINGGVSRVL
jgi:hypothetical protein